MKIQITIDLDDDYADPDHESGVTAEADEELMEALMAFGTDIQITKAPQ